MEISALFKVIASALEAQRKRMNVIVSNMANAHTTRTAGGGPYRRKDVVFVPEEVVEGDETLSGVRMLQVVEDPSPFKVIYNPGHPDADSNGYVRLPNVDVLEEMVNMMMSLRSYEASISALNTYKGMLMKTLEIGR